MNDFLRQLRSGGGKRFDKNRRSYDGGQYRGNDRHNNRDRKNPPHRKNYDHGSLQAIKKILETIAEGQKSLAVMSERQAHATERIANALEVISGQPYRPADETVVPRETPPVPETEQVSDPGTTPEPQTDNNMKGANRNAPENGREAAMKIILARRKEGEAFDQIAEHLEKEHVPTLSGKGKWRAQSVSRLYNQQVQQDR